MKINSRIPKAMYDYIAENTEFKFRDEEGFLWESDIYNNIIECNDLMAIEYIIKTQ